MRALISFSSAQQSTDSDRFLSLARFFRAYQARCKTLGKPKESLELVCEPIPQALEWGEVLVSIRAAPINPADLYDVQTGGQRDAADAMKTPFVAGNDGLGE